MDDDGGVDDAAKWGAITAICLALINMIGGIATAWIKAHYSRHDPDQGTAPKIDEADDGPGETPPAQPDR